ncbi:hypothetical protein [Streptomyces sp. NPDC004065]|uniref:hypothetical protein n=1 Tax=Streptomyces sp. NPDC004065 TaxID=3364689 RepID=UPI00384A5D2B
MPDDDPERDWEIAAELAVQWTEQECSEQDAAGVLVLNAFGSEQTIPSLGRFAARHICTTPRADRSRIGRGVGPVLVYAPDEKTLDFAMQLARGASIAVVESISFPLRGWAHEIGAVDLTRPDTEREAVSAELADAIDRLDFHKNNGFGDRFGKQQAERILRRLHDTGTLDRDTVVGALAARGASARALKNLTKLIDALVH